MRYHLACGSKPVSFERWTTVDTDDLSDEAYAIIEDAHGISALLGSELAVSGSRAASHFRTFCRSLNRRVHELSYRSSNSALHRTRTGALL